MRSLGIYTRKCTRRGNTIFNKFVCRIHEANVVKTNDFAETNRACGDKTVLTLPERIEAEMNRLFPPSASKKEYKKKCFFTKRIPPENVGYGRRPATGSSLAEAYPPAAPGAEYIIIFEIRRYLPLRTAFTDDRPVVV